MVLGLPKDVAKGKTYTETTNPMFGVGLTYIYPVNGKAANFIATKHSLTITEWDALAIKAKGTFTMTMTNKLLGKTINLTGGTFEASLTQE